MRLCVCETVVVFTDCESCTRPISTKPGSMEAGEYGLTLGTCFVRKTSRGGRGRRDAVVFIVCFGCGGFSGVFHDFTFSNSCTRPLAVRDPGQSASTR